MKKLIIFLLCVALCAIFAACKSSNPVDTQPLVSAPAENAPSETAAPVFESFEDLAWTRETNTCIETIRFLADGGFRYSCACGDPVNDADLCEGYDYDEESKIISLLFEETTEETITNITVQSCNGQTLVLDFAGDVRTFQLAEN